MHSFAHHNHSAAGNAQDSETHGLVLKEGWRYDLHGWLMDTFRFRGEAHRLKRRAVALANMRPGEQALDVGCGTGTLALDVQRRVGATGRVVGVDPGAQQIARARSKAARRHLPAEFRVGVIERLAFPDQTFDVVFSTLMMHHLSDTLKRQGLAEVARVLKRGGRLVIADFTRKQDRQGRAARFHAGGSSIQDLVALVKDAGFEHLDTEEAPPLRFSAFPGAGIISARKR